MLSTNENLLKAFKSVEAAVKTAGYDSVLSYENKLKAVEEKSGKHNADLSKITLSRQIRNYLSHEGDFSIESLTQFLNELAGKLSNSELPVKKFTCKVGITADMKVQDALLVLTKRKTSKSVPVMSKTGAVVGSISYETVCNYLAKNNVTASTKVKALMGTKGLDKMFSTVKEDTHMCNIDEEKSYIVENAKGQVIGWY